MEDREHCELRLLQHCHPRLIVEGGHQWEYFGKARSGEGPGITK